MVKYQRLTIQEREEISRHIASGHSLRGIAAGLHRAPSSISRLSYMGLALLLRKITEKIPIS